MNPPPQIYQLKEGIKNEDQINNIIFEIHTDNDKISFISKGNSVEILKRSKNKTFLGFFFIERCNS